MDHVTLGNPSRKDREKRQTAKSGDDSAISQRTAANRSAKDSRIPPLSSSEEINPPGRQEDRNISPTSLPQPDGDAPNLALGSNSSADELPETRSISADPGTNVSRALPTEDGRAPNAAAPTKSARVCDQTKHTIPAGTDQMSAHNPSANKVNPKAKSGNSKKSPKASKIGNLKRAPEQHVKTCAYCKSDQHQVHDCPQSANPRCFSCGSPDHKEKDCPDKVHNAAEDLSTRCQQSAVPTDLCTHQRFRQDYPTLPPRQQGLPHYECNPWFRGSDAYTRPYVPPPRSHQHNTEVDLPYARQPGRCDRCGTLHPPQVLHADTGGAHPPTPADFYSANKRTTLLCIECVHGPHAALSMPTTFANHVVIHDTRSTDTPTGLPPIQPGHRVQVRSHIAGMLLKYVDADTGVILRDNGEIEHVDPTDIRLAPPAPHKQKDDVRNSRVEELRNELARTQQNLLHARQQRDDARQRIPPTSRPSSRSYRAYNATDRRERPRHTDSRRAFKPPPATRPRRRTPRAEPTRSNDDADGKNDDDDRHNRSDDRHSDDGRSDDDGTGRESYNSCMEHSRRDSDAQHSSDGLTDDERDDHERRDHDDLDDGSQSNNDGTHDGDHGDRHSDSDQIDARKNDDDRRHTRDGNADDRSDIIDDDRDGRVDHDDHSDVSDDGTCNRLDRDDRGGSDDNDSRNGAHRDDASDIVDANKFTPTPITMHDCSGS